MIHLTCPECHSRCRLRKDQLNSSINQGKCPNCGHFFPIPPLGEKFDDEQYPTQDNTAESRQIISAKLKEKFKYYLQTPLVPVAAGLILVLFCIIILFGSNHPVTSTPEKRQQVISVQKTHITPEATDENPVGAKITPAVLEISQEGRTKAITSIKHHALVADANINIENQQLQLALLVSDKTPVTYAEKLGRQFTHYVKEIIPDNLPEPTFLVSVYYPDGTRVEVTTNDEIQDEEVILDIDNHKQ
jgi:predicted Zn finger-like uncharacterized protein